MTVGHTWAAFARDSGYGLNGGLRITSVKGVRRHVGIDTCQLVTPYTPEAYGRLAPGCGIVVNRDGVQQFSGLLGGGSEPRKIGWDAETGAATITVQCIGDEQHLADRLVLPLPLADMTAQTANYWTYTGPASSAMWRLISDQAGPGAATNRRVPTLVMGTDPAVGVSRLWAEQWAPVLDTLAAWSALSGADLGLRMVSAPDGLRVDLYVPRDLSAAVRFSVNLQNLTSWQYVQAPPTVTVAVAAGQGDLGARTRRVATSAAAGDLAWGRRIEQLIDQRQETDTTKLQQAATDTVTQGTGTQSIALTVADTASIVYGRDYDLGDRSTVHIGLPGGATAATVVDLIREVAFDVDATGREKITPAVGTADAKATIPGPTQQALADVAAGLARLTRNK